jgi:hypothetical protein
MLTPPLMSAALAHQRQEDYRRETTRRRRAHGRRASRRWARSAGRAISIARAALLGAGLLALGPGVGAGASSPSPLAVSASCPWVQSLRVTGREPERLLLKLCAIERGGVAHVTALGTRASSVSPANTASRAPARLRQG